VEAETDPVVKRPSRLASTDYAAAFINPNFQYPDFRPRRNLVHVLNRRKQRPAEDQDGGKAQLLSQ
jgi:hypothetical protein